MVEKYNNFTLKMENSEKKELDIETFDPETARNMTEPSKQYLCKLSDNTYNIQFLRYKIRDMDSGITLVDIQDEAPEDLPVNEDLIQDEDRLLRYQFGPDFLELKNIGTTLEFSVGDKEVKDLVMIEKHYFKDELLKQYEFDFKFCIPNTQNSWEIIYELPDVEDKKREIIASPWETKSDTFFFVQGKLVIHTRALYDYSPFEPSI
ncbi:unnamed protein product [Moneuplotes crassus]|uniref:GMP phosphodiesterase delta subunit domain-containing protein n=2 Tax=Euplotes crassus TaxID=5936 RepID=A0AAD2D6B1_EUPCR|nr:unnamed protein product [Moneuplotes crassus]